MSDSLTNQINVAPTVVSARPVVVDEQVRPFEAADAAIAALGIDLVAVAAQAAADADEHERDRVLVAQARELAFMPGLTDQEYASVDRMMIAAGHRARARRLRGEQRRRDTAAALAAQAEHQRG